MTIKKLVNIFHKTKNPKRKKRILWLFNHTPLREFEVPMLEELGFEVYCCKRLPGKDTVIGKTDSYSSVYDFDKKLTISKDNINKLDKFNFYDQDFNSEIKEIINENFGIVFFPIYEKTIVNVLKYCTGELFLHVFGREYNLNYSNLVKYYLRKDYSSVMSKVSDRFYFAPAYEQIIPNEDEDFQKISKYLPIGMSENSLTNSDTWVGGANKIMFVCPRIETNADVYYRIIYDKFKENLGDFDYEVAGGQFNKFDDKKILGFLSDDDYKKRFLTSSVMFYHSQEKRHVHYHPLEAIVYGMPLIFMAGGILTDSRGKGLPGECKNYDEARLKLKRILDGDKLFTNEVISSQKTILKRYSKEYCVGYWKVNFLAQLEN